MFIAEIKHFIDCIEGKDNPMSDILQAKRVLEIALAAKKSAQTEEIIKIN
jgi:predicted dehydrogenase